MSAACVKVIHGANDGVFDLAGATVASVRRSLVDAFNVPEDALAFVNGEQVDLSSFRLVGQETLEFCQQAGIKGAGKKKNLTEEDLNRLGLAVVGNEAIPIEDAYPDESWEATRLEAYAKAKLAGSSLAEERAILESHKSAVELFWAGCALYFFRDKKKAERHGAWTEWKRKNALADSTVLEAIKLYENAKTEDALIGLGITEAKEKFVYPFKNKGDDEQATSPKPDKKSKKPKKTKQPKGPKKPTADPDPDEEDQGETGAGDESPVIEQTRTLTTELEEIAQRLNEIAQDDMGKVDWKEEDQDRFVNAVSAVFTATNKISVRINNELFPN
jgi:hypothetical protein